jgi:methyl-accepting chemotaxis protein
MKRFRSFNVTNLDEGTPRGVKRNLSPRLTFLGRVKSMKCKFILIFLLVVIQGVSCLAVYNYAIHSVIDKSSQEQQYLAYSGNERMLTSIVDTIKAQVEIIYMKQMSGEITEAQAWRELQKLTTNTVFDNGNGDIMISTYEGVNIANKSSLSGGSSGNDIRDLTSADGTKIFDEVLKSVSTGLGFFSYQDHKEGSSKDELFTRVAYTEEYSPYDMLITATVYTGTNDALLTKIQNEFKEFASSFTSTMVITIGVVATLVVLLLAWTVLQLMKRVALARKVASDFGNCNFASQFDEDFLACQYCDLADLYRDLHKAQADIQGTLLEVRSGIHSVTEFEKELETVASVSASSSKDVATTIEEVAKANQEQANDAQELVNVVETLGVASDNVTHSVDALSTLSRKTNNIRKSGIREVEELTVCAERLSEVAKEIGSVVALVKSSSDDISGFAKTISDITDQTNLLALNASIESARAGEAGKGFAVVADEIGKLAKQTRDSAIEIDEKIRTISSSTNKIVSSVDDNLSAVRDTNLAVSKVSRLFSAFGSVVDGTVKGVSDISKAMSTFTDSKSKLSVASENLSALSEENSASTEEISSIAIAQDEQMTSLQEELKDLEVSIDSIVKSISQFNID